MALYLSRQEAAAGNLLRRVFEDSTPRQREQHAEVVVRARLLFSQLLVQRGELATAVEELRGVLARNRHCSAGWSQLGWLHERQGDHAEASEAYQKAWALSLENDPAVGFRVAFNYLKSGDPVRAIDVSKKVLARHATYPCIEEEVLKVGYTMLKP
ncbi:unnamed protein product [Phytomonas sp. Hart1]|nr:unnamed protein product [Phytomonas sp. Hart1]|eukprot:CCW67565.1 unnamed protein product [Phytomonas sp. isolate Hart1]